MWEQMASKESCHQFLLSENISTDVGAVNAHVMLPVTFYFPLRSCKSHTRFPNTPHHPEQSLFGRPLIIASTIGMGDVVLALHVFHQYLMCLFSVHLTSSFKHSFICMLFILYNFECEVTENAGHCFSPASFRIILGITELYLYMRKTYYGTNNTHTFIIVCPCLPGWHGRYIWEAAG